MLQAKSRNDGITRRCREASSHRKETAPSWRSELNQNEEIGQGYIRRWLELRSEDDDDDAIGYGPAIGQQQPRTDGMFVCPSRGYELDWMLRLQRGQKK